MRFGVFLRGVIFGAAGLLGAAGAGAYSVDFRVTGGDDDLADALRGAALVAGLDTDAGVDPAEVLAAARGDYARLLAALYDAGHYGGQIHLRLDGREAATIGPLDAPARIGRVEVSVTPGPRFSFAQAKAAPLPPGADLPEGYRPGAVARSGVIASAARDGVTAWRAAGHAKARLSDQRLIADHRSATLAASLAFQPGPRVRFGQLRLAETGRTRPARLAKIAGFPQGEVFAPAELDRVRARLLRTGVFASVALTEAERLGPDDSLDVTLGVVDQKPRRLGFGAEVSSLDGVSLSGYWLHRNLWRGAERLRVEAEIEGIGAQTGGTDYTLGLRLERPATPGPDTSAYLETRLERLDEEDYTETTGAIELGFSHWFSEKLTAEAGLGYAVSRVEDALGTTHYRRLELPMAITWENRDTPIDPRNGIYATAAARPFLGFGTTGTGAQIKADLRGYRTLGRVTMAGRVQLGSVTGSGLLETPRDYLFYSGGGGTVRGQPYQSLGVSVTQGGTTLDLGGRGFVGVSLEARTRVTDKIGVVAFYDAAGVGTNSLPGDGASWHSGAGLGLRYDTGIGPIRLDVAGPVSGGTGTGAQVYIGIGQAF
ncbi:autotransporter assembly complex protein TamA [Phaeovulum vinaykumarii]|uniref:Autotransporter secretion outer membrane protein TamA n=1 Tax=Phaeovulum vinaykumarii TaxID=407234 RepID=A0A1N7K8W9_9RHOB|nr:BamA/TamA family outer membrane protein [Phaeovulum vinaykumarii]SIS57992.1 autotransporter secretion outer membrane protein TamA [Phaeovulum vinaykumarii]SOB93642.1 autotransporter secretion outer membrane protein TamA [Phaeovulum vinaykumarii]